jgi:adenosylcobinamide-phosphate synthase
MATWTAVIALLFAFGLDLWLSGKPISRWHPVVWVRTYLGWMGGRIAPRALVPSPDWLAFSGGALAWYGGAAVAVMLAWLLQWATLSVLDGALAGIAIGAMLKPMLSWRLHRLEVMKVETALAQSLDAGRRQLGRVDDPEVMQLDEAEVRESAIEALAANLNVSVVAPVFWFLVAGLPGAVFYRFAQMAGEMWGYRGFRAGANWEWAGKWAARADDVLSWLPSRITAFLIAALAGGLPWGEWRREAGRTPSPNRGWPTAAMALALGRRLRKPGACVLNRTGDSPQRADTARALKLSDRVVMVLLAWACLAFVLAWERPW